MTSPVVGRRASPVFVGRTEQLDHLTSTLAEAADGRPGLALVGGDAGIGKTRLVGEVTRRAADDGWRVLFGGCVDLGEGTLPYAPVVEWLRDLARDPSATAALAPAAIELASLAPELTADRSHGAPSPPGGRLFPALLGTLERLADERPLVAVLEDLHWADRSTLDLVTYLARTLRRGRLAIIGTYRTDELHRRHTLRPVLAELARQPVVTQLELPPFGPDEVSAQLAGILGEQPDPDLSRRIHERAEGNAFYAEELLAADATGVGELPTSVRTILGQRLEGRSPDVLRVLRVAAAAGREVEHRLLATVADLEPVALLDALREAVTEELLVADAVGARYRFRHALLQEAVYADLLPGERAPLHAALAAALEADPQLCVGNAELAHHWFAAHELDRAFAASVAAARDAEQMSAYAEAAQHHENALELWDRVSPETLALAEDRTAVGVAAAWAASIAGESHRALRLLRAAESDLPHDAPPARRSKLREHVAFLLWASGNGAAALPAADEAVALMPADEPSAQLCGSLTLQARLLCLVGRYDEGRAVAARATEMSRAIGDPLLEGRALNPLGMAEFFVGDPELGLELLERSRTLVDVHGDLADITRGAVNVASIRYHAGDLEGALAVARSGMERLAAVVGSRGPVGFLELNAVEALVDLGRWDEADALLGESWVGDPHDVTGLYHHHVVANVALWRGDTALAAQHIADSRPIAAHATDPQFQLPQRRLEARLAAAEGRHHDAVTAWHQAFDLAAGTPSAPELPSIAWVVVRSAADSGADPDDTRAIVQEVDELVPLLRPGVLGWRVAIEHPLVHGEYGRLIGVPDVDAWRRARDAADGLPLYTAYADAGLAEALLTERGDRDEALAALRRAHEVAVSLGAAPLRVLTEELALRARAALETRPARPTEEPSDDPLGLTPREREVLTLVAAGRTNRQIGEALFITPKTASVHVSSILTKLGVATRGEAAALAHREHLVRDER